MKRFGIIFLYVWLILALFTLHKSLILHRSPFADQELAVLNALVLGKIILLLEALRIGEVLHTRPPFFRILLKAVIFGVSLLLFTVLEEGVHGWWHGKPFEESISGIGGGDLAGMVVVAIITSVALIPYLMCREIARAIGEDKLKSMFFHSPDKSRAWTDGVKAHRL